MPSLDLYNKIYGGHSTMGKVRKSQADAIMEATWDGDINTRTCYLYDWYHDNERDKLTNLKPYKNLHKIPISVKYFKDGSQTLSGDPMAFKIQLKPSQTCNVPYYKKQFEKYNAIFPTGLYIDIPDNKGKFNKWLVVAKANYYTSQFSSFFILPCNKLFQYVCDGIKYAVAGVFRSKGANTSGVSQTGSFVEVDDRQAFILPLNSDTERLYYNQRLILDTNVETEPLTWKVSKIDRNTYAGCIYAAVKQDQFNAEKDYIERNNEGKIIGMWADYYSSPVTPDEPQFDIEDCKICFKGLSPQIKVGGLYKSLYVEFTGIEEVDYSLGVWEFTIDDVAIGSDLITVVIEDEGNIKVKFLGDDEYIGKVLVVHYSNSGLSDTLELGIVGL